ncbi:hypothetical protein M3Y94_00315600 [Aphelenchoides besseyi]|nr:hypothetical protein M3Y94_00315600 [Aphelenchoides besseyi]KAI6235693.1 CAP-Gly domain-containing linker protein 3 [Aphelenchoides besseyi]
MLENGPNLSDGVIDPDAVSNIQVGQSCVYYGHALCAECTVNYAGNIKDKEGVYYGVSFSAPIGMNDGSVDGVSYFQCAPKHGLFVKNYRLKIINEEPPPRGGIWSKLIKNIDVGDRVVVNNGMEGIVMTIFQWFTEERRANKPVMVGVLLDKNKKKGNSDGVYMGVRHFVCDSQSAIFVENFEIRLSKKQSGESGNLSRTNSIRSINSMASEWRAPGSYFGGGTRSTRSPALARIERPGLRSQLAVRNSTLMVQSRPSIATVQESSDKREIASLQNIIQELTREQNRIELESRRYLQDFEKKCDQLLKTETELQSVRSELEGLNFEMLEVRSLLNTLGVDNTDTTNSQTSANLLTRTARIIGLLCLHSSLTCEEEKERLCALFNMFLAIPPTRNVGSMPLTINAFESAIRSAEKVIPKLMETYSQHEKSLTTTQTQMLSNIPMSANVSTPILPQCSTPNNQSLDLTDKFSHLHVVSPASELNSESVLK